MKIPGPVELQVTDSAFPLKVFIDKGYMNLANHWHKEIEFIYFLKCSSQVFINGIGYALQEGDMLFITAGDVHGAIWTPDNTRIVVLFDDSIFADNYLSGENIKSVREKLNSLEHVSTLWPDGVKIQIKDIIFKLQSEYQNYQSQKDNSLCKFIIKSLLYELIAVCLKEIPEDKSRTGGARLIGNENMLNNLRKVLHYINQNYKKEISLEEAASVLNFSTNYFVRFWKKFMGVGFHAYLNRYRVNIAISMLMNKERLIGDIAFESGFKNIKTFNRVFKKTTGLNPGEYKKVYF